MSNWNGLHEAAEKYIVPLIFASSSIAHLAHLMWEEKPLPVRRVVGACVLSGFAGAIVCLLLFDALRGRPSLLAAISILAGMGGANTLDFLAALLRKLALRKFDDLEKPHDGKDPAND